MKKTNKLSKDEVKDLFKDILTDVPEDQRITLNPGVYAALYEDLKDDIESGALRIEINVYRRTH